MKLLIVLILTLYLSSPTNVTATLYLTQYQPLLFTLTFSQQIPRPQFQLLLNNMYNMPYTFSSQNKISSSFTFQSDLQAIPKTSNIQMFNLIFNSPLAIANGNLDISSYTLTAKKNSILINYLAPLGIVLVIAGYIFSISTVLGRLLIQFIQLYILFMFQTTINTTLYTQLYTGLLLIPPTPTLTTQFANLEQYLILCMTIPLAIVFFFALTGYLNKKINTGNKSILGSIINKELSFNLFLKIANIFTFNLLFNSIMFVNTVNNPQLNISQSTQAIGKMLIYFNIITYIFLFYLKIYILNPKPGETVQSWQNYLKGQEFKSFKVLHQKLHIDTWYKRNFQILLSLKMSLLIFVFFWTNIFQYFALLIEFLHIFYIFTFRPFSDEFFLNTKVVCRLFFFIEFIIVVLGNLYYSLGAATLNYQSIRKYVLARDTLFLLFQLAILCIVIFQIYFKCANLNYQFKLVREAHQFKFELVEKTKTLTQFKDKRHKETVYSDKSRANPRKTSFSELQSSQSKNLKDSQTLSVKHSGPQNRATRSKSKSRMQYELMEMMELSIKSSVDKKKQRCPSDRQKEEKRNDKKKIKWNQQSLLASFVNRK